MCDNDVVDIYWCHQHETFANQCCGKEEKIGWIEGKEVETYVRSREV